MREYKITLLDEPENTIILSQDKVDNLFAAVTKKDYKPMIQKDLIDFAELSSSDGLYFFNNIECDKEEAQNVFETILSKIIENAVSAAEGC